MKVGCHELIGHGTGKLLREYEPGKFNFDKDNLINPLTNEKLTTYYKGQESFELVFPSLCRSMEECRADLIALYFGFDKRVQKIFGVKDDKEEYENFVYIEWMIHIRQGILGLIFYNKENDSWGQPHMKGGHLFSLCFYSKINLRMNLFFLLTLLARMILLLE